MRKSKHILALLLLVFVLICLPSCSKGLKLTPAQQLLSVNELLGSGESGSWYDMAKSFDQHVVSVSVQKADVASFYLGDDLVIVSRLNSENVSGNLESFLAVIDKSATKLASDGKGYMYFGVEKGGTYPVASCEGTYEQFFFCNEGISFWENGVITEEQVPYKAAFTELVKQNRGVSDVTDWDYFMYRNRFPESGPDPSTGFQIEQVVYGSSCLGKCMKMDMSLFKNSNQFDYFIDSLVPLAAEGDPEGMKIMKDAKIGSAWFDIDGSKVMIELVWLDNSGTVVRDRKWFNGWSDTGYGGN